MELLHYFDFVDRGILSGRDISNKSALGKNIIINSEENPIRSLDNIEIALIGIPEERGSLNKGCSLAPDPIRKYFYLLNKFNKNNIADMGNVKQGNTINDTYCAVRDILIELLNKNIIPVLIGGSQDLTYANFLAYEKFNSAINIVSVDSRFDFGTIDDPVNSDNFLSKIISQKSNCLFNFTNIGYQSYYISQEEIDLMKNLLFDYYRLGFIQSNLNEAEPALRDAALVSFDINAIRQSDAPGHFFPSPNGLYGEEACQIARYAGLSDKVTSFGIYEANPKFDHNGQTAHLAAEIIWHFIEGVFHRKKDYPFTNISEYKKIIVKIESSNDDIIFYNNPLTDRWWMEVPYKKANYEKSIIISCSLEDYDIACTQEIPDRWWKAFQKIC
ncbi:MAG: formimidoylglutamase [Bacteroidia bacterium]|nr:formimidoylglutamase [Bacteroidia bacterium]